MTGALRRRAALAFQKRPDTSAAGPSFATWLGEVMSLPLVATDWLLPPPVAPARHPRTVVLLPGFLSHSLAMHPMEQALVRAGHKVRDWGLCVNLVPTEERLDQLADRLSTLHRRHERKVALVGWSLGGIYAREVSRRVPHAVQGIVTMGAPFSGDRRANNAWRLYQFVTGHDVDEPPVPGDLSARPPVPSVALWSRRDGVVDAASARGRAGERDAEVELDCTHMGFASNRRAIAEVLRQIDGFGAD